MKKIYLFVWFIPFIFTSCEKELMPKKEELNESQYISTVSEEEFLNFLNSSYVKSTVKSSVQNDYDVENWRYEPIRNTNEFLAVIPYDYGIPGYSSRILMLKIMGELQTIVFHLKKDPVVNTSPYFTGLIRITDLEGNYISGYRVNNGSIVSKFVLKRNKDKTREKKCQEAYNLATDDFCNGTLEEVIIDAESDPSTTDNYIYIPYMYLDAPEKITDEEAGWNYIDGGGGGTTTTPTEEEDKIDDSQLKDCHSKILDSLKSINTGIMGKMIQKLAGSNPTDYNWAIDYNMPAGSSPDATATTDPVATNSTSTTHINLNRVQYSTDLSMARTFVHEAVHAFLAYQYRYDRNAADLNYTEALNNYASQHNTNANDTHHVLYLQENLVTPIANALQEMGIKLGYNLPHSFYLDLAYGGLYNSNTTNTIFNNLVPNQADRDRIKNRISAETDNRTVNGVSPAGKKAC